MTAHLVSFSGQNIETLVFLLLKLADGAFNRSSMRGFCEVSEYGKLMHHIGNFRALVVG